MYLPSRSGLLLLKLLLLSLMALGAHRFSFFSGAGRTPAFGSVTGDREWLRFLSPPDRGKIRLLGEGDLDLRLG